MKNNNILEYKGYHTKVVFDSKELVLRGKIEGIGDLVNFECENLKDIEKEFHEAVDDYLEFCKEVGKEPDKEYKGTFNVRISPELHKKLAILAMENGDTLNASVEKAIVEYVSERHETERNLQYTMKLLADMVKSESVYRYNGKQQSCRYPIEVPYFGNVRMKYKGEVVHS